MLTGPLDGTGVPRLPPKENLGTRWILSTAARSSGHASPPQPGGGGAALPVNGGARAARVTPSGRPVADLEARRIRGFC